MPNSFAHIELTTDDLKSAQKFYAKVFAWKLNEMPGMSYTMIDVGNGQQGAGGGMQAKPMPEAPTGWMPYVQVDSVKATLTKAAKAGASVTLPFTEIGNMGAIGVFKDPQGCAIGVWEAKQGAEQGAVAPPASEEKAATPTPAKKAAAPAKKAAAPAKKAAAPAPAKKAAAPAKKAAPAAAKKAPVPAKKGAPAPAKKAPGKPEKS